MMSSDLIESDTSADKTEFENIPQYSFMYQIKEKMKENENDDLEESRSQFKRQRVGIKNNLNRCSSE